MSIISLSVLAAQIEAILFLSPSPVSERSLKEVLGASTDELYGALNELAERLESEGHGIVLKSLAGGWVLSTKAEFSEVLSRFSDTYKQRKINLSRAAIETAAIIAYSQPVTRSEIDEIRGVKSDGVVSRLLDNGLIKIAGRRKKGSGSPLIYRTTQKFLEVFGLNSIADLPELDEFENENIHASEHDTIE